MSIFTAIPPSFTKSEIKNIVFNINEGKKIKIERIEIIGNNVLSTKKIIRQFKNTKPKNLIFWWRGRWDQN